MADSPVAIVTGAAQGLGAGICTALLKKGYKVCVADIQDEKGEEFVKEQQKAYGERNVLFSHCDVTKISDYEDTFKLVLKTFKRVDFLMNNAGIVNEEDPKRVIEVNLIGVMNGIQTALRYMGKSNGGKGGFVISTGSLASYYSISLVPAYCASKHGVIGFTKSYGKPVHFEKEEVMFAAICPSAIDTPLLRASLELPDMDTAMVLKEWMSPEFVAGGVLKILEDRINGSALLITPDKGYEYIDIHPQFERFRSMFN